MKRILIIALLTSLSLSISAQSSKSSAAGEDAEAGVAIIAPKLDVPFFHASESSLRWWIVEDHSGHLEDTMDGTIDANDLLRVEHTANCISTHQGEHRMDFCKAQTTADGGVTLKFSGGMPAYASALKVTIDRKLGYQCSFSARYPGPTHSLKWKITRKELHLKSPELKSGARILGWLSITFDEIDEATKVTRSYKIDGHFKPVLQHATP